jgi:hypothetical protein
MRADGAHRESSSTSDLTESPPRVRTFIVAVLKEEWSILRAADVVDEGPIAWRVEVFSIIESRWMDHC